jgi:hypothetical protein
MSKQTAVNERMYLVKINGQHITMTEAEYELYLIYGKS